MANEKQVDLIVRAQLQNGRTLTDVTKSLKDLEKALEAQADAAKRGEDVYTELLATQQALANVQDEIGKNSKLIQYFNEAAAGIKKAEEQVTRYTSKLDALRKKTAESGTTTEQQAAQIARVGTSLARANTDIERYQKQQAELIGVMNQVGIETTDLAGEQVRLSEAYNSVSVPIAKAKQNIEGYAKSVREAKEANRELAAAEEFRAKSSANAKLVKDGEYVRWWVEQLDRAEKQQLLVAAAAKGLSDAMERQKKVARELAAAHQNAAGATSRHGTAAREAAEKQKRLNEANQLFTSTGRTTLSLLQRIRGEILAITASYVGLYGAINGASKSIDAYNQKQAVLNQLTIQSGGDRTAAAREYEYIAAQAERLGVSLEEAAKGYAKFSAAATFAGRSQQENRFVFESVSEVARVAGLTNDQLNRIYFAISQIDSKGRVMAEEFNQQLGDALPGLTGIAKQATKGLFEDFNKAMKDGKVSLDVFVSILAQYRETVQGQLPAAIQALAADQERFNNEIFKFKILIAESGFADSYKQLITDLITFFRSDDGKNFAKDIGGAFSAVADSLRFLLNNLEEVKLTLKIIATLFVGKWLYQAGVGMTTLWKNIQLVSQGLTAATGAVRLFQRAFLVLTSALIGFEIGTYLYEQFAIARKAGAYFVQNMEKVRVTLVAGFQLMGEAVPVLFEKMMVKVVNTLTFWMRKVLGIFATAARAIGKDDLANSISRAIDAMTLKSVKTLDKSKEIIKKLKVDLASIDAITSQMVADADAPASGKKKVNAAGTPTPRPTGTTPSGTTAEQDEKAAARRLALKERLEAALKEIEARIERNEKQSLASRLAAIDDTYFKLLRDIRKLGGAEGAAMEAELTSLVGQLKLQETRKFNDELLKEQERIQTQLESVEAAGGRKSKTDLDARLAAVKTAYQDTYRDIAALRERLLTDGRDTAPADEAQRRLDAGVLELQNLERKQFYMDELARREKQVNDLIEQRSSRIEQQVIAEKAGLQSNMQTREQSAVIVKELQPEIERLTDEALAFAAAMQTALDPATMEAFKAKMMEARVSAQALNTELFTSRSLSEMLANGAVNAFDGMAQSIGGAITGLNSWGDAIRATRNAFLQFAADFLREIATMILKQQLMNALQSFSGSGGFLGGLAGALNGLVLHSGGVVGSTTTSRAVSPSWFANAPRYHSGGISGLAPDEYPAILKKNEEVLTQSDPRNVMNGGASGGAAPVQDIKIMNMIDSGSVMSEGLSTQSGQKAIFNFISANRNEVKTMLGVK